MEKCIKCGEITNADTRNGRRTTYTTCHKCKDNYKAERASMPPKSFLRRLVVLYKDIGLGYMVIVEGELEIMRDNYADQRVVDDIKSVYDLLDKPNKAMARIAEILTCGGRIYDEYSDFLKPKEAGSYGSYNDDYVKYCV